MSNPKSMKDIFESSNNEIVERFLKKSKHIKFDFQEFGMELAMKLNDSAHKSLYMRLAKNTDEPILREALSFSMDYNLKYGSNRGKIFMWKLKEIKNRNKENKKNDNQNT